MPDKDMWHVEKARSSGIKNKTCTGKSLKQNPKVVLSGTTLKKGTDNKLSHTDN